MLIVPDSLPGPDRKTGMHIIPQLRHKYLQIKDLFMFLIIKPFVVKREQDKTDKNVSLRLVISSH